MLPFVSPIQKLFMLSQGEAAREALTTHDADWWDSRVGLTKSPLGMSMQVVSLCVVSCVSSIKRDLRRIRLFN